MKKRVIVMLMILCVAVSMTACVGMVPISDNSGSGAATGTETQDDTGSAPEKLTPVTFRFNYIATGVHVPYYVALEKGYYKEVGLDVTIGEGTGSGTTAKLVGMGNDMIGLSDMASIASAVTQGIPIKAICPILKITPWGVITLEENGINEPKDIEGKKIGVTLGDGPYKTFEAFVNANNIDINKVELVAMDGNAKPAALFNGSVHGILAGGDNDLLQVRKLGGNAKIIAYGDYGAALPGICLISGNQLIKENPDLLRRFISATMKGFEDAHNDVEGGVDIMLKYVPTIDRDLCREGWLAHMNYLFTESSKTVADMTKEEWEGSIDILRKYMGIDPSFPYEAFYTQEVMPDKLPARWDVSR